MISTMVLTIAAKASGSSRLRLFRPKNPERPSGVAQAKLDDSHHCLLSLSRPRRQVDLSQLEFVVAPPIDETPVPIANVIRLERLQLFDAQSIRPSGLS